MVTGPSAAKLFELVWTTLVDLVGTTTTATLIRKASKSARAMRPGSDGLSGFEIICFDLEFSYCLPDTWHDSNPAGVEDLRFLVQEALCPLLQELTGDVVINLLARHDRLREHRIVFRQGEKR